MEEGHTLTEHNEAQSQVIHADTVSDGCLSRCFGLDRIKESLIIMRGDVTNIFLRVSRITSRDAIVTNQPAGNLFAICTHNFVTGKVPCQAKSNPIIVVIELSLLVSSVALFICIAR